MAWTISLNGMYYHIVCYFLLIVGRSYPKICRSEISPTKRLEAFLSLLIAKFIFARHYPAIICIACLQSTVFPPHVHILLKIHSFPLDSSASLLLPIPQCPGVLMNDTQRFRAFRNQECRYFRWPRSSWRWPRFANIYLPLFAVYHHFHPCKRESSVIYFSMKHGCKSAQCVAGSYVPLLNIYLNSLQFSFDENLDPSVKDTIESHGESTPLYRE